MRHTFIVVTVKRWLKSVYIYGSYRKIKTGVPLFGPPGIFRLTQTTVLLARDSIICRAAECNGQVGM